jgi:ribosome-associated protein
MNKKVKNIDFELNEEFIELIKLLKLLRIAESGGQAKMFVDNGEVLHNGEEELRKRAKIRKGDSVEIFDLVIKIQ